MCLEKSAHGLEPRHEIFHKPFKVDITYDTVPTPREYRNRGLKPGEPLKVWHVQTRNYATDGGKPGVVSMGDGFADSPDAEVISGGVNHKTPTAVAIGRHGSFFHWGFDASPKDMTESGRLAFLNSVVYAAKFDRAPVLVRQVMSSRDRVWWMLGFITDLKEQYDEHMKVTKEHNAKLKAIREKAKTAPGDLTPDEKAMLEYRDWPEESYEAFCRGRFDRQFPADLVKRFGHDAAKYRAYYEENRPYLFATRRFSAELDEDAKALGIPNYDPKLLDACVAALEQKKDADRASRLLKRYTGEDYATPAEWRAWLTASRADLFFSDVGGFRYFHKAGADEGHRRAVTAMALAEPTNERPVSLTATVRPTTATAGDVVTVAVRMRIAPGWHTYATAKDGSSTATRLEDKLPDGAKAEGNWRLPAAKPQKDGGTVYTGDVVFLRTVRLSTTKPGTVEVPIAVEFQACDAERCLPPEEVKLTATVEVKAKPAPGRGEP